MEKKKLLVLSVQFSGERESEMNIER